MFSVISYCLIIKILAKSIYLIRTEAVCDAIVVIRDTALPCISVSFLKYAAR